MKNKRGALLLETLLSLVVLSVSIGVIIQAMTNALRAQNLSRNYFQSLMLLENSMIEFLATPHQEETGFSIKEFPPPYESYELEIDSQNAFDFSFDDEFSLAIVSKKIQWPVRNGNKQLQYYSFYPIIRDE